MKFLFFCSLIIGSIIVLRWNNPALNELLDSSLSFD